MSAYAAYFCPACAHKHTERVERCVECGQKMTYGRPKKKRNPNQRRSNLKSTQRRAKVDALRRRDGDKCWLCHGQINFDLPPTDPWGWSLDHLRPVSKLGSNRLDNLRLAHSFCNKQRGSSAA